MLLIDSSIKTTGSCSDTMKVLITIKGIAPLMALAFLADIGDTGRFTSLRKINAYLELVPIT